MSIKFVAPFGPCVICLQQMADGLPARRLPLRDGNFLVAGYCSHVEAGFFAATENEEIHRWTIKSPIGVEEWNEFVDGMPETIAGVQDGLAEAEAERRTLN